MEGWMKWAKDNEASIVDLGSPLGKTKRIDAKGISDSKNEITAYTIVQAESHEAAAELFANHPHFMIFPGQSATSGMSHAWRECQWGLTRLSPRRVAKGRVGQAYPNTLSDVWLAGRRRAGRQLDDR